ncbi:hypothetical protein K469DRAFT_553012 [Zopfia rhizophila CBS 207.26]|uniref:F-box domain-containing protein n=1 Tax=Zopfia rhizophila CBS 207.26 TaxID=1314779 RepID=A0A6A6ENV7_9PEZI|nr:hypothetical protein K469DRAFT_553012 [Zopfia rhizophila CBS 207.26]
MELLDVCYEVLIRILEEVNPEDLAACARTSLGFRHFIKENQLLFKTHYLKHFDDPRQRSSDPEPSWKAELQRVVKCQKILQSNSMEVKREYFKFVAKTIESLVETASETRGESLNRSQLITFFDNPGNLDAILFRSSLFQRAGTDSQVPADNEADQQLSAKLHCLYGVPLGPIGRRSLSTHPYARSRVYDLRNYTDNTRWGPFREDGSMKVHWEMLEAIMIVLGYNSGTCCQRFIHRFKPVWCDQFGGIVKSRLATQYPPTLPIEPDIPLELKDPYNISGIWLRIVCFLVDYNDLYAFNFGSTNVPADQPRGPITTEEVIRHIIMRFKVTKIEPAGQFDNQALPVAHFTGSSRSVDAPWDPNANSRIRGIVRLNPEGEVRWTTVSIFYGGEERWRSEGIQVGGPNSKRGVIGTWFDKDYDLHGPAGPTAFWKASDRQLHVDVDAEETDEESDP